METIKAPTIKFLKDLKANNTREWFKDNKDRYEDVKLNAKAFLADLVNEMNKIDVIEKSKLFRIHRDVRFSKDKTPYNSHISMSMNREGAYRRGGYFLKIKPGESILACGFWGPNADDLKLIRSHIAADDKPLRKILASKKFKDTFGSLEGEQVKTAPKGYSKDHPSIDLLKYKQLIVTRKFTDKEVKDPNFIKEVVKTYKSVRPFFDYMSDILTHDLNGVPLYG